MFLSHFLTLPYFYITDAHMEADFKPRPSLTFENLYQISITYNYSLTISKYIPTRLIIDLSSSVNDHIISVTYAMIYSLAQSIR